MRAQRKYSLDEIERLREAIRRVISARQQADGWITGCRTEEIEAMVRTYMVNGTLPEEVEEKADLLEREHWDRMLAERRALG